MVELCVHDIGRADQPDATVRTLHKDRYAALSALFSRFDPNHIRGESDSGTVGSLSGSVFQATHVWSIRVGEGEVESCRGCGRMTRVDDEPVDTDAADGFDGYCGSCADRADAEGEWE